MSLPRATPSRVLTLPIRRPLATALMAVLTLIAAPAGASVDTATGTAGAEETEASAFTGATTLAAAATPRARAKTQKLATVEVVGYAPPYLAEGAVSATRTDTPLRDVPQSVTVLTEAMIDDQAMRGLADVVRYVPGVGMAQGEGNRDTPIFRGSSSTADMFIDGMRDDVQYFRDLYNIESVEVLKGPNAMMFGRGGTGGLINRVSKQADWSEDHELKLQLGAWNQQRLTADLGQPLNDAVAFRVTALAERADSFRDGVEAERWGLNPTLSLHVGEATTLSLGYEHFRDERIADRGISSYQGRPVRTDPSTFFGDPARSPTWAEVDAVNALVEHDFANGALLRNRTRVGNYDKFYQNVFPGAVNAAGTGVAIQAYNQATQRENQFNQTDLVFDWQTGALRHTVLAGAEFGRQETDNRRLTGFFTSVGANATSVQVDLDDPVYTGPIQFRAGASDADNHGTATGAAFYVQDQVEFSPHWQAVLGLRQDRFDTDLRNNRNGTVLHAEDDVTSPRLGLIYKPVQNLSIYANASRAFLPRSGEQLASLSATTAALDPERFDNLEIGAKWDVRPDLAFTAAIYRLDRSNVAVVDPTNPAALILLAGDAQRVRGFELGLAGNITDAWSLMGGYAWQDGEITRDIRTSPTAVIAKGTVLAQVPEHSFSLWNRYDFSDAWGAGIGVVHRGEVYTSTSNTVTLPGYTRFDAALFWTVSDQLLVQVNLENVFDREYYASAHSDTNISPGTPRTASLSASWRF